jgi:hypothetical protein
MSRSAQRQLQRQWRLIPVAHLVSHSSRISMAYDLHIERKGSGPESERVPIPLEEWCTAVAATDGVRLFAADTHTFTNPTTGDVISMGARKGDTEVFFPEEKQG